MKFEQMESILNLYLVEPLFNACIGMLNHLHIQINEVSRIPVSFESLYRQPLNKALQDVLAKVKDTYFIGTVDEASLSGHTENKDAENVTHDASEGRYAGMMVFAVDMPDAEHLTRTECATLTRGFNRIACAQPVVLFIRHGKFLSLATCERSDYTQQWRDGEKLGKVCILRDINCEHPHRGHIDILKSLGDKAYPTFEELYKHWMDVFSSELLTKKFYAELSDWYAWAVQVARFPNDISTNEDDAQFNHESCIRLITRLIFVWFLKQKHLIPEEFFDEQYIKEHFIEEFDPHQRKTLLYDSEQSKYYRLILQNLFFATLNCPITEEGKEIPNNRRFRVAGSYQGKNKEYAVNNLMRYKADFKEGGAEEFVQLANSCVPFLNGGLFDCLDKKPEGLYYDGFSENKQSLRQLYLPDWLFFGDEVGRSIDLSQWYGDAKKKKVSARGIIDILKRYNFTIEENTPLDQEVSLDPELLGKAFENLLASYNPETQTSARKQTGSFYTPREIVQYMVDESLVAHLKRTCGDELEPEYRRLLSYSTEETALNNEQRKAVMQAIYHCRVLDPACGSGAFPMGVLQQMVHVLRKLDPSNEMWKDYMIDLAIEQSRKAFSADAEEERKARLDDIEESFNKSINDPDYARKLYLIENCIYGVDIQPIAVQISKLRFFISLVVDQKPTKDAAHNFGIRPLPNLESKFVAANTLIPLEYDGTLVESSDEVRNNKERLKELNHKIFLARRKAEKDKLRDEIINTRKALSQAIEDTGFVGHSEAELLAGWDPFDQNASSSYFDPEWMFGVKDGFDIVIGNPPYIRPHKIADKEKVILWHKYEVAQQKTDIYAFFIEFGCHILNNKGILSYITPKTWHSIYSFKKLREMLINRYNIFKIGILPEKVFDSATVETALLFVDNTNDNSDIRFVNVYQDKLIAERSKASIESDSDLNINIEETYSSNSEPLGNLCKMIVGIVSGNDKKYCRFERLTNLDKPCIRGGNISRYSIEYSGEYIWYDRDQIIWDGNHKPKSSLKQAVGQSSPKKPEDFELPEKIVMQRISKRIIATLDTNQYYAHSSVVIIKPNDNINLKFILGIINSHYVDSWLKKNSSNVSINLGTVKKIPIPPVPVSLQQPIIALVDMILAVKKADPQADTGAWEREIDLLVYHLYGLTYDEVLVVDPETTISRGEYEKNK